MANLYINQIFIRFSSQIFCGLKPATLFNISADRFSEKALENWKKVIQEQGLSIQVIEKISGSILIFVYDFMWLRKLIDDSFIQAYLRGKGYSNPCNTRECLNILFKRLQNAESFPHEVGVFLGYPIEDVIQFEEKQGKCCKFCGYWKSYCNPEEAKLCCEKYKQCSRMCTQWFDEGYSVPQIIKKYKKMAQQAA